MEGLLSTGLVFLHSDCTINDLAAAHSTILHHHRFFCSNLFQQCPTTPILHHPTRVGGRGRGSFETLTRTEPKRAITNSLKFGNSLFIVIRYAYAMHRLIFHIFLYIIFICLSGPQEGVLRIGISPCVNMKTNRVTRRRNCHRE